MGGPTGDKRWKGAITSMLSSSRGGETKNFRKDELEKKGKKKKATVDAVTSGFPPEEVVGGKGGNNEGKCV